MERDPLVLFTGILALGFGAYCIILCTFIWIFQDEFNPWFSVICLIYGIIYLVYGSSLLFSKKGDKLNFLAFAFVFGSFWISGMPWYLWPVIIMPPVILILTIILVFRWWRGMKIEKEER